MEIQGSGMTLVCESDIGNFSRNGPPMMGPPSYKRFPYHSHTSRDSYGSGMGVVWEWGVPLLGVPRISLDDMSFVKCTPPKVNEKRLFGTPKTGGLVINNVSPFPSGVFSGSKNISFRGL